MDFDRAFKKVVRKPKRRLAKLEPFAPGGSKCGHRNCGFVGGVFGAITLAIFAVWMTPIAPGADPEFPGPGDGFSLAGPFLLGAVVGFWGGIALVIFGLHKLRKRKAS